MKFIDCIRRMFKSDQRDAGTVSGFEICLYNDLEGINTESWNHLATEQRKFLQNGIHERLYVRSPKGS